MPPKIETELEVAAKVQTQMTRIANRTAMVTDRGAKAHHHQSPSKYQGVNFKKRRHEDIYRNAPESLMCEVCEAVPFQFHHFGAFCCNRCRAFFRR